MTTYLNAFRVRQAIAKSNFNVSNYFPVIGNTVSLTNTSTDNDTNEWTLNDGINPSITSSATNETIIINEVDGNIQTLSVNNTVSSGITHSETIYGLTDPAEAYYEVSVSSTVCRVGDTNTITVSSIYSNPDPHSVRVEVINSFDNSLYYFQDNVTDPIDLVFTERASYHVKVIATTGSVNVENKQHRLITVTPALQPILSAYTFEVLDSVKAMADHGTDVNTINGITDSIESGTTIVLKLSEGADPNALYRLRLENLIGTAEAPIIITFDEPSQLLFNYHSWYGIIILGCEHIVFDGKGYQNIEEGFHLKRHPDSETGEIAIQIGDGSTFIEIHNVESSDAVFTNIICKTDPNVNVPEFWRGNFAMEDTKIHNCNFHDSRGEGIYIGYFDMSTHTETNSSGVTVSFRAHELKNTKIYRNKFITCGWDGMQLNNSTENTEIHDNYIKDAAFYGEPDQNTGMSLGLEGKIYNNVIDGCTGLGIQIGALGAIDVYNNVITNIGEGSTAFYLLSGVNVPEQYGTNGVNNIPVRVFNNNLITSGLNATVGAQNVCQYEGLLFKNNVVTTTKLFSGQEVSTMNLWTTNASSNIIIDDVTLPLCKFGSLEKVEFNIYPDSLLISGGDLIGEQYDARGFNNWSNSDKFIGAFAGIIKLADTTLTLNSIIINNGDALTSSRDVIITTSFIGNPTHYMISELIDFSGATWIPYSAGTINFNLSEVQEVKTVYLKLKNNLVESNIASSSIEYSGARQFLVTFTKSVVYPYPDGWNAFHGLGAQTTTPIPIGTEVLDLIDQNGSTSSLGLTVTKGFSGTDSNLANSSEVYPYPVMVVNSNWLVNSTDAIGSIVLSGCNDSKFYDIVIYAHRDYTGVNQLYSVNNIDQSINPDDNNLYNQVIYNDVSSVGGNITIDVKVLTTVAYIGVLDITEK